MVYLEPMKQFAFVPTLKRLLQELRHGAIICAQDNWEKFLAPTVPVAYAARLCRIGHTALVWAPFDAAREKREAP